MSEFSAAAKSKKIDLKDLTSVIRDDEKFTNLKRKLVHLENKKLLLDEPLKKPVQDKINRQVAYKMSSIDISKWAPIVKANREADNLKFPLDSTVTFTPTIESFSQTPRTKMEQRIDEALNEFGLNESQVIAKEQLAMKEMTVEEAEERRTTLRQMRSLLFYEEQKNKRKAKIKSKKYHKLNKKKKFDQEAHDHRLKLETERARERMTLRHKKTNPAYAQLERNEELQEKILGSESSESESETEEEETALFDQISDEEIKVEVSKPIAPTIVFSDVSDNEDTVVESTVNATVTAKPAIDFESQTELIAKAFAIDDVVAEFEAEKEEIVNQEAPKEEDITLPGWGSWGGKDLKSKKKFLKNVPGIDISKRKDKNLKHVIINEKVGKFAQKYQINKVPFPYKAKEQYERALDLPVGREWNTLGIYQKRIEPTVTVKKGSIIHPVEYKGK